VARFQFASTLQFGQNTLLLFIPAMLEACDMIMWKMDGRLGGRTRQRREEEKR